MILYIIRHGETFSNAKKIVGDDNDSLNNEGIKNSEKLKKIFKKIKPDLVISSPLRRAIETSKIIFKHNKEIIVSDLVQEKNLPSEIVGKKKKDWVVKNSIELMEKNNISNPGWHLSDEENFKDVERRVALFVEYLNKNVENTIVVVSHKYFIKALLFNFIVGYGKKYKKFVEFYKSVSIDNCKITVCQKNKKWKVLKINSLCV
ncbi:MAG: hypothetical protein COV33_01725 [Candidatus Zambryskibacteria bacterium CG10_big_fil_rev_8_21_14_0_10_34_34]|uniref:Histidine phosphatase family protein n=1 Tax=Candidatus Zambryskibacteria bacterium CG10_big_fil_rev_8_21_14_0_10_34_34 TaxID=1975114 RepID=A0A2H0R1Y1_9BACT|nr:MAG: hypothetical protein COV33_01725 [Candidatus Zambryskibacteria bacterium CG10_big_fil_rev_8_21_14_0_10_34_34]